MVSVHRPVHSTCLLIRQTDHCTPLRIASKVLLNTKATLSQALLKPALHLLFKTLPEWAATKTQLRVLSIAQLHAQVHQRFTYTQLCPLYLLSTLYITRDKFLHDLPNFFILQRKAGQGLGMRLVYLILLFVGTNMQG